MHSRFRTAHRTSDNGDQFLEIEGFWQIFISTTLAGANGGHKGVLRAHHNDRNIGAHFFDAGNQIEAVFIGHDHIGDNQITLARRGPAIERARLPRCAYLVASTPQCL